MTSYQFSSFKDQENPDHASIVLGETWCAIKKENRVSGQFSYSYIENEENMNDWINKELEGHTFQKIQLASVSRQYALLPKEVFPTENLTALAESHFFVEPNDILMSDTIYNHGINNVFSSIPIDINTSSDRFTHHHYLSPLISLLIKNKDRVYLFHSHESLAVITMSKGKLVSANLFSVKSEEEILYFVMQAYKIGDLSPMEHPLFISGRFTESSNLYKLIYRYVNNINWLNIPGMDSEHSHVFYDVYLLSKYF